MKGFTVGLIAAACALVALPATASGDSATHTFMLKMGVVLTPDGSDLQIPATLTVFCIIGPNPPNSHDDPSGEGITLVVPGILNFNKIVSGMNVYIQTS